MLGFIVGGLDGITVGSGVRCKEGIGEVIILEEIDGMLDGLEVRSKLGCGEGTDVGEVEVCCDGDTEVLGVTEGAFVG